MQTFLAEKERTQKTIEFRKRFKKYLENFDFSKVDITEWGDFQEIDLFLEKSLVEGNQILETRFLVGDKKVKEELEEKKKSYNSIERQLKNFFFNRFYFNQYFRQRARNGALNIKYCKGGSREFLFFYWYDNLYRTLNRIETDDTYQPKVKIALENLFKIGKISLSKLEETLEAVGFLMVLRGDILRINKNTKDKGLTFIDSNTLERLVLLGYPKPQKTKELFERYHRIIAEISDLIYEETIKLAGFLKGKRWEHSFRAALNPNVPEQDKIFIDNEDPLLRIALIWGASENNHISLFNYLANKYKTSDDWATICSIAASPLCNPEILDYLSRGIAKEKG
jgi:hypothetical protein